MHRSLASILFPGYRRRILGLLLLHPEEALHGREVARRLDLPAGSITRELSMLADAGLLRRERRGNQQVYSADTSCPIYEEVAAILRKTSGLADVLSEALAPLAARLRIAFVFGSMARSKETAHSDVDLMLIGDVDFVEAVETLHVAQARLAREINPRIYSPAEFASRADSDPFLCDVLSKPKLFLIGSEDDFAELGRDKP
jgi:DNA-binding transcriptional ArsR family regulator